MTTQNEALRMAELCADAEARAHLEYLYGTSKAYTRECQQHAKAAKQKFEDALRRLQAENEELLEALEDLFAERTGLPKKCGHDYDCICAGDKARNIITKSKGVA